MAEKIRKVTILVILAIIIAAVSAIAVVQGKSIDRVSELKMSSNSTSAITIRWKKVRGAEGYRLYVYDESSNAYKEIADIKNGDTREYTFDSIQNTVKYNLKITAYKYFNKTEYESEPSDSVWVYSKPKDVDFSSASNEAYKLSFNWKKLGGIDGYEIQYSKDDEFSKENTKTKTVSNQKNKFAVSKLNADDKWFSRCRSFITAGDEKIYGDWSKTQSAVIKDKVVMPAGLDVNKPMVALSFDDGPAFNNNGTNTTAEILKVLEEYGARATFFMVPSRINDSNKYLLKKEIELGCELGNHTYDHNSYGGNVTASDISRASNKIREISGRKPTVFRCPGGSITSTIINECKREGMPLAYWSVDTEDWKSRNAKSAYKIAMNNVYDGAIILMHDIYPSTAKAVKMLVPALIEKGYQIVTVSELITAKTGKEPKPGQQYVDYKTINNNT